MPRPGKFFCTLTSVECKHGCRQVDSVAEQWLLTLVATPFVLEQSFFGPLS